jgi:hypothetical protein
MNFEFLKCMLFTYIQLARLMAFSDSKPNRGKKNGRTEDRGQMTEDVKDRKHG